MRPRVRLWRKAIEPEIEKYYKSVSEKVLVAQAKEVLMIMARLADLSLSEDNFYINLGSTKDKSSLTLNLCFGPENRTPVFANTLQDLIAKTGSMLDEMSYEDEEDEDFEQHEEEEEEERPF